MSWQAILESSIGVSHQKRGIVCQDYGAYKCFSEVIIGAVADGAGSAKYSEEGATLAVQTALNYLEKNYQKSTWNSEKDAREIFSQTLGQAQRALYKNAEQKNYQFDDLACTLLLFLATPDFLAAMQIGDGFIVVKPLENSYQLLFYPDKGEYTNETTFITSSTALNQMQVCLKQGKYPFICASTDGVERLAIRLSDYTPYPGFFEPFENYIKDFQYRQEDPNYVKNFLSSSRLNSRTDDDKTLLFCLYDYKDTSSIPPILDPPTFSRKDAPIPPIMNIRLFRLLYKYFTVMIQKLIPFLVQVGSYYSLWLLSNIISRAAPKRVDIPKKRFSGFPSLYLILQNFSWSILAGLLSSYLLSHSDIHIRVLRIYYDAPDFFCISKNSCLDGNIFLLKFLPFLILGLAILLAWMLSRGSWLVRVIVMILALFFPIGSIIFLKKTYNITNPYFVITNPYFFSLILPIIIAIATGIIASMTISSHRWPSKAKPLLVTVLTVSFGFLLGWFLKVFI